MWSEVEILTNEDTNTVRLGNVPREETCSGLYQVDTLVKISTNTGVQADPRLSSSSGADWSVVVADKTVILFDESYQTVLLRLHFDTDVDAIDVCLNGHFLVVCEKNGNLHLIYVPQKRILLTRALVQKPPGLDKKTYHCLIAEESKSSAGMYHVFLVVKDGFFHITNLALAKIEAAVEKLDVESLKELQSLIKIDFCSINEYHDDGSSTALMFYMGSEIHLLIGGGAENILTHWMMDAHQTKMRLTQSVDPSLIPGVRKMVVVENLLFILDTEDTLSLWDLHLLVMIDCWTDLSIHDFELATECGSTPTAAQDSSSMKMIMLMKENNSQVNSLQIRCVPSMAVCLSLNVSAVSCLSQTKINMDTIYFLEGIYENPESQEEQRSAVVVRCFTETLPESRLGRLLYKHQFEEAEKFAIAFELDLELVYKVKLDFVLERLASASVGGCGQEVWSELVEEARNNLTKITDEQYVVEYCLKAPWPTFETAEKMLNHAASQYPSLQIQEALARLATFCSLHSTESFNGIAWIEFLNSDDNLGDILSHLKEGDMKGAQLLWLRYEGQIAADFDEHKLEAVLGAIPEDLPSQDLCPWFRTIFVPFLRRMFPTGQKTLARWLEHRARNLELTEKSAWPQNGLDVAVLGLPSLWTQIKCNDTYGAEELAKLKSLVSNLHQLLDLHKKYNCRLSLSIFEKGNVRSVAFYMLDKVPAPELVAATVANSVQPYAEEHDIPFDELLLQYIKDLLERCSSQTTTLFTEWEAKAVAVLHCMGDTDLMVDAVLEIMQKAVVPWSNVVEKLVQHYLEMEGPKQELLKESYVLMEIRKLLRSYGIRNFNLSNRTQITTLIRYILKQDLPSSLDDSLMLAEACKFPISQIHFFYLVQLTTQGEMEKCLTFLKKLSHTEAERVIERLTSWARGHLQDKNHISEEHKKHQMVIAQLMVEALKFLQKIQEYDAIKSLECKYNLDMFKAIAHLQEDFDLFFTPADYEDPNIRKQMQEHHMVAYENTRGRHSKAKAEETTRKTKTTVVANDCDGKTRTISTEASVRRLGWQLQRTEQELGSDLALRALRVGKVEKALKILSELHEHFCNAGTGKVLFIAAKTLCQMLEADMPMVLPPDTDLPAAIHHLACQAITVCNSDLLLDCLELCKCTRLAMDVYHQCQLSDNYGFVAKDLTSEAEKSTFQEVCILLDPASVLPVQYEITNCMLPLSQDTKLHPLDCSCLSHCSLGDGLNYLKPLQGPLSKMLQMLQECSQLELALRVLLNSHGSLLQHITSNVMDMKLSVQLYEKHLLKSYNVCLNEIQTNTSSTLKTIAVALLNKVFNWRVVDCDLAIGLCTMLPEAEVFKILWKVIDDTWQDYDKILALARIGANLCCLYNKDEEQKKFLSVITDAEWGIQLGKLGISMQPVFRQQPKMKRSLIPVLVKSRRITPDIITQFCNAFGLDHSGVINQYITTLLLQQESEDVADDLGPEQEEAEPLCHADALERVLQLLPMLHSSSELMDSLCAAISKLSPYNYERIEVVLKIMQATDEDVASFSVSQATGLLNHLKSYKRICPPSEVESTYLLENSLLPSQLSSSRLPFHLLLQTKHYWKIITPELSEETFPMLLLITKLMKVSLDKLYMSLVVHIFKNKMKPMLLEQRKKGKGHSYNKETFKVAKTMMKFIHCIQNTELATATAHNITQELPPGYEKTQSLKFCLALAEARLREPSLEETARARAETFLSKLRLQFQRSATENTLMSRQLNSPELMKLTGLPARLIMALYEQGSIEQHFRDPASQTCLDIHAVVKELAHINNVDALKIRNVMLEKWICKTGPAVSKDAAHMEFVSNIEEDPDLMRVVCMLQSSPMDDAVHLLGPILSAESWPLSPTGPRLTFCHRTRALLCLVRLVDAASLEARLQIPQDKIQSHLKCCIFVSQLEALNIPYTVQSFLSSPKEALVKGLFKNHSHEPQAVRLVADLCLEYQVYDPQLWNSLLQKLLAFNMISHLQRVLETVVALPALWEISCFSRTWSSTILSPFLSASVPLSPDQQKSLYRTFILVLKCPFLLNLDLIGIANHFAQLNLPAFALGTLLLIPSALKKEQQIHGFLSVSNPVAILEQVDELMNTGELAGIPVQVRESVFKFISKNRQYQSLLKTKHLKDLQQLVVSSGGQQQQQLKDLMEQISSHNFQNDADSLACDYMKQRDHQRGGKRS